MIKYNKQFCAGLLIFSLLFSSGCGIFTGSASKKRDAAAQKVVLTDTKIDKKDTQLENSGRAYLYGAKLAIEHVPDTNKVVAVRLSEKFINLAELSFGPASIQDAHKMDNIVSDLLLEADLEIIRANADASNSKIKIKSLESKIAAANVDLEEYNKNVIFLESERNKLLIEKDKNLSALEKLDKLNAGKATEWDKENSLLSSLNPFKDLYRFFKKLAIWGVLLGVLLGGFKLLGFISPAFGVITNVVDAIFGFFGKAVFKIWPKAKEAAGVVSTKVYDTLGQVVQSIQKSKEKIAAQPIEDDILKFFADDHIFTKNEVRSLLEAHSDAILKIIFSDLDKVTDADTKGVIANIKNDLGMTNINTSVKI